MGERRFILEALLAQDAAAMLGWLAAEARAAVGRHKLHEHVTGPVALFWSERAESAGALLGQLVPAASTR
jgi:hypothetical protein